MKNIWTMLQNDADFMTDEDQLKELAVIGYGALAAIGVSYFLVYLLGKKRGAKNACRYPFA